MVMMLRVNPTRMELLRLKRRLIVAVRGHKLLKDKQDELMKNFFNILDEIRGIVDDIIRLRDEVYESYFILKGWNLNTLKRDFFKEKEILIEKVILYSLRIPVFKEVKGEIGESSDSFFELLKNKTQKFLDKLIEFGIKLKILKVLSKELSSTRRRVNALEYILIPEIKETIKYIYMKLEEMERGNLTRLMRVKEKVRR
ncbi:MAG: V-type ATP synthase subunit D [Caldiserica bacterium]|nr:MAG: V-type ATP synthase subunit D [Caldisericota bacterium]